MKYVIKTKINILEFTTTDRIETEETEYYLQTDSSFHAT